MTAKRVTKKPDPRADLVEISVPREDPHNLVGHDPFNREVVLASLRDDDQATPLVLDSGSHDPEVRGIVRKGNLTLECMVELGYSHVWVNWKDFSDEAAARRYAARDNRSGELHHWKWEATGKEFQEWNAGAGGEFDFLAQGWREEEVAPLLDAPFDPGASGTRPGVNVRKDGKLSVTVTKDQERTIRAAITAAADGEMSEGAALQEICRVYLDEVGG